MAMIKVVCGRIINACARNKVRVMREMINMCTGFDMRAVCVARVTCSMRINELKDAFICHICTLF